MLELGQEKAILMPHQMLDTFVQIGKSTGNTELEWTPFANLLRTAVEAVVCSPSIVLVSSTGRLYVASLPSAFLQSSGHSGGSIDALLKP
jgi:hypothetical protein